MAAHAVEREVAQAQRELEAAQREMRAASVMRAARDEQQRQQWGGSPGQPR